MKELPWLNLSGAENKQVYPAEHTMTSQLFGSLFTCIRPSTWCGYILTTYFKMGIHTCVMQSLKRESPSHMWDNTIKMLPFKLSQYVEI